MLKKVWLLQANLLVIPLTTSKKKPLLIVSGATSHLISDSLCLSRIHVVLCLSFSLSICFVFTLKQLHYISKADFVNVSVNKLFKCKICQPKAELYKSGSLRQNFYKSVSLRQNFYKSAGLRQNFYKSVSLRQNFYKSAGLRQNFYKSASLSQ